ncbi:MAG: type 4a pilus biogenesis protein PilO [Agarilytica sp.]
MADLNQYIEQLQNFDINDVDWDRIGTWPAPAKILVCVVAVVVILVACHFLIVKDKNAELGVAKNREVELRKSFETKAYEAANLERYRAQMREMAGTLQALVSRLPSSIEMPGLLDDLEDKAIESRLEIEAIKPQSEVSTDFYIELPLEINVTGGYHEFGAFVSGIAGMPRIVTLHDFTVVREKQESGMLKMDITAKTYRYKPQE